MKRSLVLGLGFCALLALISGAWGGIEWSTFILEQQTGSPTTADVIPCIEDISVPNGTGSVRQCTPPLLFGLLTAAEVETALGFTPLNLGGNNTFTGTNNFTGSFEIGGTAQNFPASGLLVGTTDTQTLSGKTIAYSGNTLTGVAPTASPTLTGTVTLPDSSTATSAGLGSVAALGVGETAASAGSGNINVSGKYKVAGSQIGTGNLADTSACQSWTPADESGGSNSFSSVSAQWCKYGNIVYAYGTVTYPGSVSGGSDNAVISLPVAVPNQSYAIVVAAVTITGSAASLQGAFMRTVLNSSTAQFFSTTAELTNTNMAGATVRFMMIYPAS